MKKLLLIFAAVLSTLFVTHAQACSSPQINITGTVKDSTGAVYVGGSGVFTLVPQNVQWTYNQTNPVPSPVPIAQVDSFGHFSICIMPTNLIDQQSSNPLWQISFTSAQYSNPTAKYSFTMTPMALTAPQDITAQIQAQAALLPAQGGFIYIGPLAGIPATCKVGQLAFITDATPGSNQYLCTATNTWTQQTGGGGGGGAICDSIPNSLQFNNSNVFGCANLTVDSTHNSLTIPGNDSVGGNSVVTGNSCQGGPRPYYDVTCPPYNASASGQTTTGSMSSGGFTLNLASAIDFQQGQYVQVFGAGAAPVPSATTIASVTEVYDIPPIANANATYAPTVGATCSGTTATITTAGWNGLSTGESATIANVQSSSGTVLSQYNITATITSINYYQFSYTIASCPGNGGSYSAASPATVTPNAGSTDYDFEVAVMDSNNAVTAVSAPVSITNANPVAWYQPQTGIQVTINRVANASMYVLYFQDTATYGAGYHCWGAVPQTGYASASPTIIVRDFYYGLCPTNAPSSPPSSAVNGILVSKISTLSGTTATLANSASANVSSVLVQHDDTAPILAAINAACASTASANSGGAVFIPTGNYHLQSLTMPNCNGTTVQITFNGNLYPNQPITYGTSAEYISLQGGGNGAIQPTGASPEILVRGSTYAGFANFSIQNCANDCFLFDPDASNDGVISQTLNGVVASTHFPHGYTVDCENESGSANMYNYKIFGGSFYANNSLGVPAIYGSGCNQWSFKQGPFFEYGGLYFAYPNNIFNGAISFDGGGEFLEGLAVPFMQFKIAPGDSASTINISNLQVADEATGADGAIVRDVPGGGILRSVNIYGSYAESYAEGNVEGLNVSCSEQTSGCAGLTAQAAWSTMAGQFFDSVGGTTLFANPRTGSFYGGYNGPLSVVANGQTYNDFNCFSPLPALNLLCHIDYQGNAFFPTITVGSCSGCSGSSSWSSLTNPSALLSLNMAAYSSVFGWSQSNAGIQFYNTTAATSGSNNNSPWLQLCGNYYNAGNLNNCWQLNTLVGTGSSPTSTLQLSTPGTGGLQQVSAPDLQLTAVPTTGTIADGLCMDSSGNFIRVPGGNCYGSVTASGSPASGDCAYFTAAAVISGTANCTLDTSGDLTLAGELVVPQIGDATHFTTAFLNAFNFNGPQLTLYGQAASSCTPPSGFQLGGLCILGPDTVPQLWNINSSNWRDLMSRDGGTFTPGDALCVGTNAPDATDCGTPVVAYTHTGTVLSGSHFVEDTGTLSGGTLTVTLSGSAVFTSNATYNCKATDRTTPANAVLPTLTSGTSVTFTGTSVDAFNYTCWGN